MDRACNIGALTEHTQFARLIQTLLASFVLTAMLIILSRFEPLNLAVVVPSFLPKIINSQSGIL